MSEPVLSVAGLTKDFEIEGRFERTTLRAVDDVSFDLAPGETLGVVGESGCGKTTLGRLILRLERPTGGTIRFHDREITALDEREMRPLRRHLQVVFQDPFSSLNPRMRVRDIVAEPLQSFGIRGDEARRRVARVLEVVGLAPDHAQRFPHAFSGGQRQRIGIARALALEPRLIVCDEAVSALDVSIQAQILNLLKEIQARYGLSLLFISHNLGVVRHLSHRILVMYVGRVVEVAPEAALFEAPRHPYTRALIAAVPEPDPRGRSGVEPLAGDIPDPASPPGGCVFHPRCPMAADRCRTDAPALRTVTDGHLVRCHFA